MLVPAAALVGALLTLPPDSLTVQGRIASQSGLAVDGTYTASVTLYSTFTGSTVLWTQLFPAIPVTDGIFNLVLQGVSGNMLATSTGGVFVGVKMEGEPELPRTELRSVPFALIAGVSADLACSGCVASTELAKDVTDLIAAAGSELATLGSGCAAGAIPRWTGSAWACSGDVDLGLSALSRFRVGPAPQAPAPCDSSTVGLVYFDTTLAKLRYCDGAKFVTVGEDPLGSIGRPAKSCKAILNDDGGAASGVYFVVPSGVSAAIAVWCDMDTLGGGFTFAAIVNTGTSTADSTFLPGVTVHGQPLQNPLGSEYSANMAGFVFSEVLIRNFSNDEFVTASTVGPKVWDASSYSSLQGYPAKSVSLAGPLELRMGYYVGTNENIPLCISVSSVPLGWACDSDSTPIEGWVDAGGGEFCGTTGSPRKWAKEGQCTVYATAPVVTYGLGLR